MSGRPRALAFCPERPRTGTTVGLPKSSGSRTFRHEYNGRRLFAATMWMIFPFDEVTVRPSFGSASGSELSGSAAALALRTISDVVSSETRIVADPAL